MTGAYLVITLIIFSLLYAVQLYYNKSLLLKLINLTVVVAISSAVYFTFETYKGWPTIEQQSQKARVIAVTLIAPQEGTHGGAIYYWALEKPVEPTFIQKFLRYQTSMPYAPRAFYVEYTPQREQLFSKMKNALEEGNLVFMDPPKKKQEKKSKDSENKEGGGKEGEAGEDTSNGTDKKATNNQDDTPDDYDADHINIVTPEEFLPPKAGEQ